MTASVETSRIFTYGFGLVSPAAAGSIRARAVVDVDRPPLGLAQLHLQALAVGFGRGGHQLLLGLLYALVVRQRLGRAGPVTAPALQAREKRGLAVLRTYTVVGLRQIADAVAGLGRAIGGQVRGVRVFQRGASCRQGHWKQKGEPACHRDSVNANRTRFRPIPPSKHVGLQYESCS